jgi:hypothetical protein
MQESGKYLVEFAEENVVQIIKTNRFLASLSAGISHLHACGK